MSTLRIRVTLPQTSCAFTTMHVNKSEDDIAINRTMITPKNNRTFVSEI